MELPYSSEEEEEENKDAPSSSSSSSSNSVQIKTKIPYEKLKRWCQLRKVRPYNFIEVHHAIGTIVALAGCTGGFSGPANIYDDLALNIGNLRLSLLRIHIRPWHMKGAEDVLIVLRDLFESLKNKPILLMGWSMGGASVIEVARRIQDNNMFEIKGLVTLASQGTGTGPVKELNNIPIYIFSGTKDTCCKPKWSESIYNKANEPKELVWLPGASHCMTETFDLLKQLLYERIMRSFDIKVRSFTTYAKIAVSNRLLVPEKLECTLGHQIVHALGVRGRFMMEAGHGARMERNNNKWILDERISQALIDYYNLITPNTPAPHQNLENVIFKGWDTDRITKIYFKVQDDPTTRENVGLLTQALQSCLDKLNEVIGKKILFVKPDEENFDEEDQAKPWWRRNYGEVSVRMEAMERTLGRTTPSTLKLSLPRNR